MFRAIKAATPGGYTFILPATREVPRRLVHPKKRTVGVRIPASRVAQALVTALGEPLMSSTLILPGTDVPISQGWEVQDQPGDGDRRGRRRRGLRCRADDRRGPDGGKCGGGSVGRRGSKPLRVTRRRAHRESLTPGSADQGHPADEQLRLTREA